MHILLGILAALGIVGLIVYRIVIIAKAGRQLGEAADDARKFVRRTRWRRNLNSDPLAAVDDPRVAGAAFLAAVAECRAVLTERQEQQTIADMANSFQVPPETAREILAEGRWLARHNPNIDVVAAKLLPVVAQTCTVAEREDLIDMTERLLVLVGGATDLQRDAIARARLLLGLERA